MATLALSRESDSASRTGPERVSGDSDVDKRIAIQLIQDAGDNGKEGSEARKERERGGEDVAARRAEALELSGGATDHANNSDDSCSQADTTKRGACGAM